MKKIIKLATLVLLASWVIELSQAKILAATDDCEAAYISCLSNSDAQYDYCETAASNEESSCDADAENAYDDCVEYSCGGPTFTACIATCQAIKDDAVNACFNNYNSGLSGCADARNAREASCSASFEACQP
jgi:hypothetical protein